MAFCPGLPGWAGTRKAKPIWILLKQETVSGSGISWGICKSAPRSRQITMPAPHNSFFYRPDALPATQLTASKHWRQNKQRKKFRRTTVDELSLALESIMTALDQDISVWFRCYIQQRPHQSPCYTGMSYHITTAIMFWFLTITDISYIALLISATKICLQCFDAVGWAAGRASGL